MVIGLFLLFSNMVYAARLIPYLILPNSSINVTQNQFFNFTTGVRCKEGDCGNVTATLDPNAVYNPSLGAPYCETSESPCIAGSELLMSADNATYLNGTPAHEPHSPNTIDGCPDIGPFKYLSDEVIENMTISSLDGIGLNANGKVRVDIYKYCPDTFRVVNLFYKNNTKNSPFIFIKSIQCPVIESFGLLSTNFTLGNAGGNHTIRGVSQILGDEDNCSRYELDETDDLTFYVQDSKETILMDPTATPFYTATQNPTNYSYHECLQNMTDGKECNITWEVNATGAVNSSWDFFTIYTSDNASVLQNETEKVAVTIVEEEHQELLTDYNITTIINGAITEYRFYHKNHHFMTVVDDAGTFNIRPHPGVDVNGWGSSWYMQPFLPGANLSHTTIQSITDDTGGISVEAIGYVSNGSDRTYGTWNSSLYFSYDPDEKKVTGYGDYKITLAGALSDSTGDLNLYKIASNYLNQTPLLTEGIGDTGDMGYVNITGTSLNGIWIPTTPSGYFPGEQNNVLSIDVSGEHNVIDSAAQGYAYIEPAYKPSLKVVLSSLDAPITFGGFYDVPKGKDFWEDNVGITPLIKQPNSTLSYDFNVSFESLALEDDGKNFTKFNKQLELGWNLISFPLNVTFKSLNSILRNVDVSNVLTYNGTWAYYKNNASNNFRTISEQKSYWVDSAKSQNLSIEGDEFSSLNLNLSNGWNFIGYPSLNASLLNETSINYSVVYSYINPNWTSNVKGRNESLNKLNQFNPGYGYWVKADSNITNQYNFLLAIKHGST
ncbi:MAG: hypothetical protein KJ561_07015 [Nanoarchaeota archaeon]|nr:hypothetical protein [Nanoarchaeota archaeon]